jgi:hypothetical protein
MDAVDNAQVSLAIKHHGVKGIAIDLIRIAEAAGRGRPRLQRDSTHASYDVSYHGHSGRRLNRLPLPWLGRRAALSLRPENRMRIK